MRCPYCVSEIADTALACPNCTRDLYLFKPLLEKIGQLEAAAALAASSTEARIAALEEELAAIRDARVEPAPMVAPASPEAAPTARSSYAAAVFKVLLPVLALLLAAHGVLLFVYDVKPLYLRIATILIPMPFGLLLATQFPGRTWTSAASGFAMAVLAVLGMLAITSTVDKVPLLPQDARDWRETMEYVASIGLAVLAGLFAGGFYAALKQERVRHHKLVMMMAKAVTRNEQGEFGLERAAINIDKLVKAATPAATAVASIYAGVKGLLGDGG
ncbi:MAG: hypothetical protein EXR27_11930 [Betaproteobacteria bacterium]|nr:hypothetical protein [Betaproteobacteria bacterium]